MKNRVLPGPWIQQHRAPTQNHGVKPKAPPQLPVRCVCSALALVEMVSSLPEQEASWISLRRICHESDKSTRNNKFMQIPNICPSNSAPFCTQRALVKWMSIFGTKLRDGQTMVTAWYTSFMYKMLHSSTVTLSRRSYLQFVEFHLCISLMCLRACHENDAMKTTLGCSGRSKRHAPDVESKIFGMEL